MELTVVWLTDYCQYIRTNQSQNNTSTMDDDSVKVNTVGVTITTKYFHIAKAELLDQSITEEDVKLFLTLSIVFRCKADVCDTLACFSVKDGVMTSLDKPVEERYTIKYGMIRLYLRIEYTEPQIYRMFSVKYEDKFKVVSMLTPKKGKEFLMYTKDGVLPEEGPTICRDGHWLRKGTLVKE